MSQMTDRCKRPYPENQISPNELPDSAPNEHPTPWTADWAGNGHVYVYDANKITIAHVYIFHEEECDAFEAKMNLVNGTEDFEL